ncbi:MAG: MFS transporter [Erysipelotrichaceae bacterium]
MPRLWTKNFTIITVGTVISMLGSAVASFAIGLLIYEKTNSTFLYSLFFVCGMIPNVLVPMFAGPYLDKFSRKKAIVALDYISGFVFLLITFLLAADYFNYFVYLFLGVGFGVISSIYHVAYESFYPSLITEGNFSKAYSISSMIWPICNSIMVPIAATAQQTFGFVPLFAFNAISYFIAATLEIFIDYKEEHLQKEGESFHFVEEFKAGIGYLKEERALWHVTTYFAITMFAYGVSQTLQLPFFSSRPDLGVTKYSFVVSMSTMGRFLGGFFHYHVKFAKEQKFKIAFAVYIAISLIEMVFYRSPYPLMVALFFVSGALSVTSFNIRISATQSYVPNEKRARFNSIFMVITTFGTVLGQMLGGVLGEILFIPDIIFYVMLLNIVGAFALIYRNRATVKKLYNRSV